MCLCALRTCTGFYIVTYALGIYNLNLLLGFLTPQVDPELEGPTLPSKKEDEFRPFVRRLPEFKFWCGVPFLACWVAHMCPCSACHLSGMMRKALRGEGSI